MLQSMLASYEAWFSNSHSADSISDFPTSAMDELRGSNWIGFQYIVTTVAAFVCMYRG